MSEWMYVECETGNRLLPDRRLAGVEGIRPTDLEKCVLMRRREGMTQQDMADVLGCSRLWVIRMETGQADPSRLTNHWLG